MRQRSSRRVFLGVGLGCAAPLLLRTPWLDAAGVALARPPQGPGEDAILERLRIEALGNYRRARETASATGRVTGEQLRGIAAHAGLLQAWLSAKEADTRLDEALRGRVQREGRDATTLALTQRYGQVREQFAAKHGLDLPQPPDFAAASIAVDVLRRKGVKHTTALLARWVRWEARRADRAAGATQPTQRPASVMQKPGDDFGGYPDPNFNFTCQDASIMVHILALCAALAMVSGLPQAAEILGLLVAAVELALSAACGPMIL